MIHIAITTAAYFHAISSTMPEDTLLWPVRWDASPGFST